MHINSYRLYYNQSNLLVLFFVALLFFYAPTIKTIVQFWVYGSDVYSHGLLLFVVSVFYFVKIWRLKQKYIRVSFRWSGYILLLLFSFLWLVSKIIFIKAVELLIIPFIFVAVMMSFMGWRQSKEYFFPIFLLLLALPLFDWIIPILQTLTSTMTGFLLSAVHITHAVEGVLILVPAGTFEVDTGCSGLNVFLVGLILSILYAYANNYKILEGAVLVLFAIVFSMLTNVIRVFIIVVVGNETHMQHPLVTEHGWLGWVVFLVVMSLLYFLANKYHARLEADGNNEETSSYQQTLESKNEKILPKWGVLLILSGIALAPGLEYAQNAINVDGGIHDYTKHSQPDGWKKEEDPMKKWVIKFYGGDGDIKLDELYSNESSAKVYFNFRYYFRQTETNEAINQTNSVYDRSSWTRVWNDYYDLGAEAGMPEDVEQTLVRNKVNGEVLIWRWYSVLGKNIGNIYVAKLYNLIAVLLGRPGISVYVVSTEVVQSYDDARNILKEFTAAICRVPRKISKT